MTIKKDQQSTVSGSSQSEAFSSVWWSGPWLLWVTTPSPMSHTVPVTWYSSMDCCSSCLTGHLAHYNPYPRPRQTPPLHKGYGHSVIFLAYFLTTLSSLKRKRERLSVKQFCRTGMGLYSAMVRALCAIDCL